MYRLTRFVAVLFLLSPLCAGGLQAKSKPPVKFGDACHCIGCHAEYRWDVKTDEDEPPDTVPNRVTPSVIGAWPGPGGIFQKDTPRKGKEKRWYALTGRVTLVKIEPDGDLHIQLVDETAEDSDLNVVVEVPFGEPWCDIRDKVFRWTNQAFPFQTQGKKFTLQEQPVITVVGKAFYDAIHGGGDTSSNRRPVPHNAAATTRKVSIWEIHPVMTLTVGQ
jgi:hypothetical protein